MMGLRVRCPNANCPAPPGSYLTRNGYGNAARTVCGMKCHSTLLTERLMCTYCMRQRQSSAADEGEGHRQYTWHASSANILMNLSPAVSSLFPAVLCGRRAVNKDVVTLLSDRIKFGVNVQDLSGDEEGT